MKRTKAPDDLRAEYDLDYKVARPNRFASRPGRERLIVALDPDVSAVFTTPEAVNEVLRALIATMPKMMRRPRASK